jgi:hypothetical protein
MKNPQSHTKTGLLILFSLFYYALQAQFTCPFMRVSIASDGWVACDNAVARIRVCNEGAQTANSSILTVNIPEAFVYVSSIPAPSSITGKTLRYVMGAFPAGDCRNIALTLAVPCTAQIGQAFCLKASATPKNCPVSAPGWDGSTITVKGFCSEPDSVWFQISNISANPTSSGASYIITEDHLMRKVGTLPIIPNGDSIKISLPNPDGSTYTFQTFQTPGHPFPEPISVSVESCGADPGSTGYLLQYPQYDGDVHSDIFCDAVTANVSGIHKTGFPLGYATEHFIDRRTTLNYRIRFQNLGTTAVQNVILIDSISDDLNLSSLRAGAASHPYTFSIQNQVLTVVFTGLQLPPASVNEPASRGFFSFNIGVADDAAIGALIENTARVTLDNQPLFNTDTTFHRLGENFILLDVLENQADNDFSLRVIPNPVESSARLIFSGTAATERMLVQISDVSGRLLRKQETTGDTLYFEKGELLPGIYFFVATGKNGRQITGKLVVL